MADELDLDGESAENSFLGRVDGADVGELLVVSGGRVDVCWHLAVEQGLEVGVLGYALDLDLAGLVRALDAELDDVADGETGEVGVFDPYLDGLGASGDKAEVLAVEVEFADARGGVAHGAGTFLGAGAGAVSRRLISAAEYERKKCRGSDSIVSVMQRLEAIH